MVNAAGFYVYYALQLQRIHSEMREALKFLPDSELEVLVVSNTDYKNFLVDDHEVKVKGKMYDIARITFSKDSVKVFCVHDENEDDLFALLSEIISKPLKTKSAMPGAVMQFIGLMFITPDNNFSFYKVALEKASTFYFFYVSEIIISQDIPPPWCNSIAL